MRTLARSVGRGVEAGEPLPAPWPIFEERKALIRRGGISMFAGPPGSMKTVMCLNLAMQIDVPTMYFSSDSDEHTMASRLLARATGTSSTDTGGWLKTNKDFATRVLKDMDHVRWSFNPSPTIDDLYLNLQAFHEVQGDYPKMTIIDILMDIDDGSGEVTQNYWTTMAELKVLARKTNTALVVAHHTSESAKDSSPPPRSAIMGKANQLPILIVTLWGNSQDGYLEMAIVKNRNGPSDATAQNTFRMAVDPDICKLEEMKPESPPHIVTYSSFVKGTQ